MKNITVTKLEKNDFEQLFKLMQASFPPAEYRTKEKQYAILDDENYSVSVFKDNGKICAFLASWLVNDFIFIEHLAVSPDMRGTGVGSAFMKEYLSKSALPVVLEVEDLQTDIAKRRINFYQRLGFVLSEIRYRQPNFDNSDVVIPLRIMYFGNISTEKLSTVKQNIFKNIYKQNGEKYE